MTVITAVEVPVTLPHDALPGADWADAWRVILTRPFANAEEASRAIVASFPWWTNPMMALRQLLVLPFGLKGADDKPSNRVGIFPIVSSTPERFVGGFDDRHLDFRIVTDLAPVADGQSVTLTTVIRRHNRLGRFYLAAVMPFHRAIIRSALVKMARRRAQA